MKLFLKHEVKENCGAFEILLFLKKEQLEAIPEDELYSTIKSVASLYINEKLASIPIHVVHIMIGSILYFSFVTHPPLSK